MANLRKIYRYPNGKKELKSYYAEFYDRTRHPKRKRMSLRTRDKTVARQKLARLEREVALGQFDPWVDRLADDGLTVQEALGRFIESREVHCSEATVSTYAYVLEAFVESLAPGFPLYGVEHSHILRHLGGLDLADATRASYLDRLRIFFDWCVEEELCKENPVPEKITRGKKQRAEKLPEFLSEEEFERLIRGIEADAEMKDLAHGNRWLLDAVQFAVGTGLRRGEIVHLRWRSVDLRSGMIHVENWKDFTTKSGRERSVPLVGTAREVVERLEEEREEGSADTDLVFRGGTGGKINGNYLSQRFRFYRRLAKLPEHISFHSLRHTFASWFVLRGGDLYRLKEILGHADMKTTLKYAHLRPDALRHEMQKTFGAGYQKRQSEIERLRAELEEARAALEEVRQGPPSNGHAR